MQEIIQVALGNLDSGLKRCFVAINLMFCSSSSSSAIPYPIRPSCSHIPPLLARCSKRCPSPPQPSISPLFISISAAIRGVGCGQWAGLVSWAPIFPTLDGFLMSTYPHQPPLLSSDIWPPKVVVRPNCNYAATISILLWPYSAGECLRFATIDHWEARSCHVDGSYKS